jgi:flagellar biosynthetic protein FlhB
MSENSTPEERTELPTDRRIQQLRKDGQMHMSHDLVQVLALVAGFLCLSITWNWLLDKMLLVMRKSFLLIATPEQVSLQFVYNGALGVLWQLAPPVIIITIAIALVATLAVMLQTNWNIKQKKIDFKISKLNPISGVKRIFSVQGVMQTLKALAKLAMILPVAYFALKSYAPQMIELIHLSIPDVMAFTGNGIWELFWKIMYILLALAVFDYFWTKFQWLKQNKMTKDEVKDERKSLEGDEATKRKIQAKGLQRIAQRIRQSVPQADVVVTNPTHYAVALKYDRNSMDAPIVVAKGRGFLALRIREIAKESGVPIMERKWLARSLYASVEIGATIPHELFKAVAEVLAYVYKIKGRFKKPIMENRS